jgi:hypothetical protein
LIPKKEPQVNGGVENFNGRFQPRLFDRRYARPGDLRRGRETGTFLNATKISLNKTTAIGCAQLPGDFRIESTYKT